MGSLTFKVVFLVLLLPSFAFSLTCEEFVERLMERSANKDYSNMSDQETAYKSFSGFFKGKTLTAKMEACDELPDMRFFTAVGDLRFTEGRRTQQGYSVCLPKQCNGEDSVINQTLIANMLQLKKLPLGKDYRLRLNDPRKSMAPKTLSYYLACFLLLSLLLLAVISTYFVNQRKSTRNFLSKLSLKQKLNLAGSMSPMI